MADITAEELRELLDYSPDTGLLRWRVARQGTRVGAESGSLKRDGYKMAVVNGRSYCAHRLAWLHYHGEHPKDQIDHINGNRADNRIENLRDVSRSWNLQNQRRAHKRSKTGLIGVSVMDSGRFAAKIGGRYIGSFDAPELAHAAYLAEKRRLHPGCTI